jgi:hypothetical protein
MSTSVRRTRLLLVGAHAADFVWRAGRGDRPRHRLLCRPHSFSDCVAERTRDRTAARHEVNADCTAKAQLAMRRNHESPAEAGLSIHKSCA